MKKVVAFLIVLLLMFSSVAVAEDLKTMTVDELVALRSAINAELISRGFEKNVTVPAGSYTIGKDIPVGEYTIRTNSVVVVLTTQDALGNYCDVYSITPTAEIGKITLFDGYKLTISASVIFAPYVGLGF